MAYRSLDAARDGTAASRKQEGQPGKGACGSFGYVVGGGDVVKPTLTQINASGGSLAMLACKRAIRLNMSIRILLSLLLLISNSAAASEAVDVDVSDARACALYDDGAVYCWGDPLSGDPPPYAAERVTGLPRARSIAVGRWGACAVDGEDDLWCWGVDLQRSMRAEALVKARAPARVDGVPDVKAADMGFVHMCILSRGGEVWCWGQNPCGEVGCGDKEPHAEPTRVPFVYAAKSVSAGINNTCVVYGAGELSCWGSDNPTREGNPFIYESTHPIQLDINYMGAMKSVSNGRNFACGIRTSGEVTCWGSNIMGQLGTSKPRLGEDWVGIGEVDGITDARDLDASYFNACAVDGGRVICWGAPLFLSVDEAGMSQPPTAVPGISNATRVALGTLYGCAIDAGQVVCWGMDELDGVPVLEGMSHDTPVAVPGLP